MSKPSPSHLSKWFVHSPQWILFSYGLCKKSELAGASQSPLIIYSLLYNKLIYFVILQTWNLCHGNELKNPKWLFACIDKESPSFKMALIFMPRVVWEVDRKHTPKGSSINHLVNFWVFLTPSSSVVTFTFIKAYEIKWSFG